MTTYVIAGFANRRRRSVRGDTYGVVCAVVFGLLIAAGVLAIRLFPRSGGPALSKSIIPASFTKPTPSASPQRTAPPVTTNPGDVAGLSSGLAYSQSLGAGRLIERGTISPKAGGYSATFQYERLNNLEQVQVAGGNFVRKMGGNWVRSSGWSTMGTPASAEQTSMLNDLMTMTMAPWEKRHLSDPIKALQVPQEETSFKVVYSTFAGDLGQRIFAFHRAGPNLQLERFSGLVGSGKDQMQLTLECAYPAGTAAGSLPNVNAPSSIVIKTPQTKPKTSRKTAGSGRKINRPE
ncbi:MAG: hypothetical protein QOH24_792 [Verrucomicrobiota bacterium]